MPEITYTIRYANDIVAKNVPEYYTCMIIQSIMTRFNDSAAAGDLQITIEAEGHTASADFEIDLPF